MTPKKSAPWPTTDKDPRVVALMSVLDEVQAKLQELYAEKGALEDVLNGLVDPDPVSPSDAFLADDNDPTAARVSARERHAEVLQDIRAGERVREAERVKLASARASAATRAAESVRDRFEVEINQPRMEAARAYVDACIAELAVRAHFDAQGGSVGKGYQHALGCMPLYHSSLEQLLIQAEARGL